MDQGGVRGTNNQSQSRQRKYRKCLDLDTEKEEVGPRLRYRVVLAREGFIDAVSCLCIPSCVT